MSRPITNTHTTSTIEGIACEYQSGKVIVAQAPNPNSEVVIGTPTGATRALDASVATDGISDAQRAWYALLDDHKAGQSEAQRMLMSACEKSASGWKHLFPLSVFERVTEFLKKDVFGFGVDAEVIFGKEAPKVQLMRRLGSGSFGSVFEVADRAGKRLAMKVCVNSANERSAWSQEVRFGAVLANVPGMVHVRETACTSDFLFVVLDLGQGTLQRELVDGAMTLRRRLFVATKLSLAVSSLQERCIFHLDLKPENVVIVRPENANRDTEPRIIDFGLSLSSLGPISATRRGTLRYHAPEVAAAGLVTSGADVWALGLMLWEIVASPSHCLRELGYRARQPQDMAEWRLLNRCRGHDYLMKREYLITRTLQRGPTEAWFTAPVWATDIGRHMRMYVEACLVVDPMRRAPAGYVAQGLSNFWNHVNSTQDAPT
ncbi:hypothetical protein CcaverHIS002_0510580 [Cutaneotrichosporon cavernicola]|uniref:Protein kinase domain-containing protein n=1 Tax=Cutaneotrichosporon cavernicola TaxID=279322 RepID=A0AA48L7T0_9TREE|nr:uncharacterized protein CcaverHIS019_0511130 [Cutaneotrichosporon cavernicola]BEI85657.1 hypothetical protein CcaverHIS002_0510580 [Cutaneotrichosporon cavernicola]BEI93485.1 hypothetical protein CcaverHIS019_0511130 [Cutaneotrichosporon cavernicola]BEJ01264.1 hypothetical protein CcaverHIS631_0511210 [Cutaneotrichosporon cavernicola]BEJ09032.1 hypothetical protein CcaverHIS641_0511260 [Cutaneotrichosporon cavernicola]